MSRLLTVAAALLVLTGAAPALGQATGSIRDVELLPDSRLQATFTVTADGCTASTGCAWSAHATTVAPGAQCNLDHLVWVGGWHEPDATTMTETTSWVERSEQIRICLYAWRLGQDILVDDMVFKRSSEAETASGSIGNVSASGGQVVAYFQVYATLCGSQGRSGCSWRTRVYELPGTGDCPATGSGHLVYTSADQGAAATVDRRIAFTSRNPGEKTRLCLYGEVTAAGETRQQLVAGTVFTPPAGGPAPTPAPATFSMDRARGAVNVALSRQLGRAFTQRRNYRRSCQRQSSKRVRCRVSWTYRRDRYAGTVTVWAKADGIHYGMTITRRRG